jgi:hypothetical protein
MPETCPLTCPICGKPPAETTRPFCSRRCADVDLGRWLTGQYRVPGPTAEPGEDPPEPPVPGHAVGLIGDHTNRR